MWDPAYTTITIPSPINEQVWEEELAEFSKRKKWFILGAALCFIALIGSIFIVFQVDIDLTFIPILLFFLLLNLLFDIRDTQIRGAARAIAKQLGWSYLLDGYPGHGPDFLKKYPQIFGNFTTATTSNEWWGELTETNRLERLHFWMAETTIIYMKDYMKALNVCAFQLRRPAQSSFSITPELIKTRQIGYWNDINFESPEFNKSFRIHAKQAGDTFTTLNPASLQFLLDIKKEIGVFSLHIDKDIAIITSSSRNSRKLLPQIRNFRLTKSTESININIDTLEKIISAISSFAHSVD